MSEWDNAIAMAASILIAEGHRVRDSSIQYESREDGGDGSREICLAEALTYMDAALLIREKAKR